MRLCFLADSLFAWKTNNEQKMKTEWVNIFGKSCWWPTKTSVFIKPRFIYVEKWMTIENTDGFYLFRLNQRQSHAKSTRFSYWLNLILTLFRFLCSPGYDYVSVICCWYFIHFWEWCFSEPFILSFRSEWWLITWLKQPNSISSQWKLSFLQ